MAKRRTRVYARSGFRPSLLEGVSELSYLAENFNVKTINNLRKAIRHFAEDEAIWEIVKKLLVNEKERRELRKQLQSRVKAK